MVEQRWQRRSQVGRIELDAGKRASRLQPLELLIPVRAHVSTQHLERNPLPDTICGGSASASTEQQLPTRMNRNRRHRHDRALVLGIEQTKGLDGLARPLGAHWRVGSRRKNVEDSSAHGELAVLLYQRLARVTHLDQPARSFDRVRASAGRKDERALREVGGRDRRARDGTAGRDDDRRGRPRGERVQRFHPFADCVVECGRPVEERYGDLGKDVCGRPAREPRSQIVGEPVWGWNQDQDGTAYVRERARHRTSDDRPRGPRQPRDLELAGARRRRPPTQLGRRVKRSLPNGRHGNSSQPSAPGRLKRSIALSIPASRATSSASATPSTIFGKRSASALVKRPST